MKKNKRKVLQVKDAAKFAVGYGQLATRPNIKINKNSAKALLTGITNLTELIPVVKNGTVITNEDLTVASVKVTGKGPKYVSFSQKSPSSKPQLTFGDEIPDAILDISIDRKAVENDDHISFSLQPNAKLLNAMQDEPTLVLSPILGVTTRLKSSQDLQGGNYPVMLTFPKNKTFIDNIRFKGDLKCALWDANSQSWIGACDAITTNKVPSSK